MKNYMHIIVTILFMFTVPYAQAYDLPDDIDIIEISFDHMTGSSSDGITLKHHHSSTISAPEWVASPAKRDSFAYVRESVVSLLVKAVHHDDDQIQNCRIEAQGLSEPGNFGTFGPSLFTFNGAWTDTTCMNHKSGSADVPSTVGEKTSYIHWYVTEVNGQSVSSKILESTHTYYVTYDTPFAPMDQPWARVLAYSCDWAEGRHSVAGIAADLTDNLYETTTYNQEETHMLSPILLNLSQLLFDLTGEVEMDCRDYSTFLRVLSNALGVGCQSQTVDATDETINTISIYPAGQDSTSVAWAYHKINYFDEMTGYYKADASLRFPGNPPFSAKGDISHLLYRELLVDWKDVLQINSTPNNVTVQ